MVNVGDLWIETGSLLLLSASVMMRITAPIYLVLN